jgi:hypothetical protein
MIHQVRGRRKLVLFLSVVLLVPAAACAPPTEHDSTPTASATAGATTAPAGTSVPERVKTAARIARAIRADPATVDRTLQERGMTREEFDDLLYEIAADPVLSTAYVRELGR